MRRREFIAGLGGAIVLLVARCLSVNRPVLAPNLSAIIARSLTETLSRNVCFGTALEADILR